MIMFTSGTTGLPKGVCQTLRAISCNAGHVAETLGLAGDDRIFINTPPYFTSGICHFLTLLANGGGVAGQLGFFFGAGLLDEMEAQGCTGFGGAPAHLVRVVEPLEEPRPHAFRFWVSSGDHLPLPVIEKLRRVLPGVEPLQHVRAHGGQRPALHPAAGRARRARGLRGPPDRRHARRRAARRRRRGRAGRDRRALRHRLAAHAGLPRRAGDHREDADRHGLKTGDFGRVDESGAVWIAGRKDDIIKRGGEKVSIVHVQQALQALGRFADVAVLAAPDDILGHVPVAFVVPLEKDGFKPSRLLRELRGVLPSSLAAEPRDRRGRRSRARARARPSAPSCRRCSTEELA